MNWILEHLQLLFIVGGAVAWWLNQRNKKDEDSEEGAPRPPQEKTFEDPELAERTRRIREEIQRKIEQRNRGQTASPSAPPPMMPEYREPPPLVREMPMPAPVAVEPPAIPSYRTPSRRELERQAEVLEQQAALAEQLRAAEEMRRATQKRVAFENATRASVNSTYEKKRERAAILAELRNPAALRRALVMREILGPPVALK